MSLFLRPYEYILTPDGPMQVVSPGADDGRVALLNQSTNARVSCTYAHLRERLACGEWSRAYRNPNTGKVVACVTSAKAAAKARYNLAVVGIIKPDLEAGLSIAEAHRLHADDLIDSGDGCTEKMCSLRQVQRLIKQSYSGGIELTPRYENRGNHRERYSESVRDLILSVVETEYARVKSRIGMRSLTNTVNQLAEQSGLIGPTGKVSRAYVTKVVINFWHPDRDYRRLDRKVARSAKAVARERIRVLGPLHRVEQDTVHMPFKVETPFGVTDNVNLMLAIDCATSFPLAWHIVTRPVTSEDTLRCLEVGMYPKSEAFARMDIQCEIDPYGTYMQLHVDNGPENIGPRVDAVATLGIDVTRTPVDSGHCKPFIERLNRSLKEALETLPGCTRFNGKDGERSKEAAEDRLMTLQGLERWIVRWLFEKWIHQPLERFITADYELHETLGITPAERWRNAQALYPLPMPPDRKHWLELHYIEDMRTLNHKTGIGLEGFRYRGPELDRLIGQYGSGTKIVVRYNPDDYRFIYAFDKKTGVPLRLVNSEISAITPAYSFSEAKKRRKELRGNWQQPPCAAKFDADIVQASLQHSGPSNYYKARRHMTRTTRTQEAVNRARENPLQVPDVESDTFECMFDIGADIPVLQVEYKDPKSRSPKK